MNLKEKKKVSPLDFIYNKSFLQNEDKRKFQTKSENFHQQNVLQ